MKYMKRGGTNKTSKKKKIYQNAGKPKSEMKMTQRDRDEQSGKSESMQYKGGTTKKPVVKRPVTKSNNFKAGMTREEVQNMPGGTGGNVAKKPASNNNSNSNRSSNRGGFMKDSENKSNKPATKKPIAKKASSYAEAKKRNPNLDNLIKKRKGLTKGTTEYNMVQNKINKAYGIGPTNRKEMTKMDSKPVPTKKPKSTLAGKTVAKSSNTPAKKKVVSKTPSTGGSGMGSTNRQKQAIKDLGIEDSKEINFNSKKEPAGRKVDIENRTNKSQDKRADRKDKRVAKKMLKKAYRKAKKNVGKEPRVPMLMKKEGGAGLKDAPKGSKGLKKLPTEVRNKMGFKKKGGKRKGMGGMKDYRS